MKYLDWLKTNPEKGYYWVKYQDCDEERIDEFTDWYDNAGNVETKFTDQPDEVISDRLTYIDYLDMVGHCGAYSEENTKLKKQLEIAVEGLKEYAEDKSCWEYIREECKLRLKRIKELEK